MTRKTPRRHTCASAARFVTRPLILGVRHTRVVSRVDAASGQTAATPAICCAIQVGFRLCACVCVCACACVCAYLCLCMCVPPPSSPSLPLSLLSVCPSIDVLMCLLEYQVPAHLAQRSCTTQRAIVGASPRQSAVPTDSSPAVRGTPARVRVRVCFGGKSEPLTCFVHACALVHEQVRHATIFSTAGYTGARTHATPATASRASTQSLSCCPFECFDRCWMGKVISLV